MIPSEGFRALIDELMGEHQAMLNEARDLSSLLEEAVMLSGTKAAEFAERFRKLLADVEAHAAKEDEKVFPTLKRFRDIFH